MEARREISPAPAWVPIADPLDLFISFRLIPVGWRHNARGALFGVCDGSHITGIDSGQA
jgi:hypothetical protein